MRKRTRIVVVAVAALLAIPMVAIAADRFNDVPDTNIFHDDIAWLADAGVTAGCNPPANDEFCPEDAVKRQQMAAFMRRFAQYLGAEDGIVSEADHAMTADGAGVIEQATGSGTVTTSPTVQLEVDFTLPDSCDGPDTWKVRVTGSGYFLTGAGASTSATVGVNLDDGTNWASAAANNQQLVASGQAREQFMTEYVFEADAGDHTAYLLASANSVTPFVQTNLTKLIAHAVTVTCP